MTSTCDRDSQHIQDLTGSHSHCAAKTNSYILYNHITIVYCCTLHKAVPASAFARPRRPEWAAQEGTRARWPLPHAALTVTLPTAATPDARTSLRNGRKAIGSGEAAPPSPQSRAPLSPTTVRKGAARPRPCPPLGRVHPARRARRVRRARRAPRARKDRRWKDHPRPEGRGQARWGRGRGWRSIPVAG